MRIATPTMLIAAVGLGCSDYQFSGDDKASEGGEGLPIIEVEPRLIDFGGLSLGEQSSPHLITVRNLGDADLHLSELVLPSGSHSFTISGLGTDMLPPNEATDFSAVFEATSEGIASGLAEVHSDDSESPSVGVELLGSVGAWSESEPDILVEPTFHDFGVMSEGDSESAEIIVRNVGGDTLTVSDLVWSPSTGEMDFDSGSSVAGPPPFELEPGESRTLGVTYTPFDQTADEAIITVVSDDPDEPEVDAMLIGSLKDFEGFSTGWYVLDDGVAYETTSNPSYSVDSHGDSDLYWYEPSGAHGLLGSSDPEADFALMRDYVLDRAAGPFPATTPFDYDGDSDLATFEWATFTYFMCDFYLPADADPSEYEIYSGAVDDGIQVMVNGEILGRITLGEAGSWGLDNAVAGQVNTLIIILVDDSKVDKYISDLGFYRNGSFVSG